MPTLNLGNRLKQEILITGDPPKLGEYPACPDLGAHEHVFKLLKPEQIGVTLTENMEMVPEQTTSAIVAHHPQTKYFAV